MLKMKETSLQFLRCNLPEVLEFEEIGTALRVLGDLIDDKGFSPPHYEEYNSFGREAQCVYDDLYESN